MPAEKNWDAIVAIAAPATPMSSTATNKRSSTMLTRQEAIRK